MSKDKLNEMLIKVQTVSQHKKRTYFIAIGKNE
jgi:hypothetical protein